MTRYLVEPRDQIVVKGCQLFSFAKNIGKNIGKYISENLSGKYTQKLFDQVKQSATDAFKIAPKEVIQKQQKQQVIWLVIKLLIKLQGF